MSSREPNATLIERQDLTDELSIIAVRPDSGAALEFQPGQFTFLGLPAQPSATDPVAAAPRARPRLTRRAYSIASAPGRPLIEFFLVRIETGGLTPRLWSLELGARIWLGDHARGEFTLDAVPPDRDLLFVATGTGIAPFVSMLREFRGRGRWRRAALLHGVRREADLGFRRELEALARDDPTFRYLPSVSREPEAAPWLGLRGRVQTCLTPERFAELAGWPLLPESARVLLCGNPAMIDDTVALLTRRGFTPHTRAAAGNLHFERYW